MDYDYFLNTYGFPGFGIAMFFALFFVGISILIGYLYKDKDVPKWLLVVLGTGFLISCAVMLIIGFILPWGSPI